MPLINQPQLSIGNIAANPHLEFNSGIVTARFVLENDIPILWQGFSSYGNFMTYNYAGADEGLYAEFGPDCYPVGGGGNGFLVADAMTTNQDFTPGIAYRPDDVDSQLNPNQAFFATDWFTFLGVNPDKVVADEYVLTKQSCQFYGTNCNLLIAYGNANRFSRVFSLSSGGYYETTSSFGIIPQKTRNGLALAVEFVDGGSQSNYKAEVAVAFEIRKIA